ncbi:MAG: ATP-binding cassette domain-containing protein [Bacteroidetes bacterium]|jgi:putative ABC transport system ATP-binding protein|nr:ATP-binding cassette domain-containing protein [Bacteroidota bacterium]
MLDTRNLSFSYTGNQTFVFPDISIASGQHLLVLGKSGTGKTTLLHLLAGFLDPQAGSINLQGQAFSSMSGYQRDLFRAQHVGVVFQAHHFIGSLSLEQNLLWAQKLARKAPSISEIRDRLDRLGLAHRAKAKPNSLSHGELQRASIIRALINHPALVLADEPTSSLDDENCGEVVQLLDQQAKTEGAALVVVTHDKRLKDYFNNWINL